jgi:hypothetical protein
MAPPLKETYSSSHARGYSHLQWGPKLIKILVENLTKQLATIEAIKREQNKVILTISSLIDLMHRLYNKIAQGGNFNKSQFKQVGVRENSSNN